LPLFGFVFVLSLFCCFFVVFCCSLFRQYKNAALDMMKCGGSMLKAMPTGLVGSYDAAVRRGKSWWWWWWWWWCGLVVAVGLVVLLLCGWCFSGVLVVGV
jgi:hypothetical protein